MKHGFSIGKAAASAVFGVIFTPIGLAMFAMAAPETTFQTVGMFVFLGGILALFGGPAYYLALSPVLGWWEREREARKGPDGDTEAGE